MRNLTNYNHSISQTVLLVSKTLLLTVSSLEPGFEELFCGGEVAVDVQKKHLCGSLNFTLFDRIISVNKLISRKLASC